jgi:urease accessory protein
MFDTTPPCDLIGENSFGSLQDLGKDLSDKDLQRAEGSIRIVFNSSEKGTRIVDVFQQSPMRVMFPRAGGVAAEEAVFVNTSGGIAGGDRLSSAVTALANASVAVTSQAAEKVYRALTEPARITTQLQARDAARLAWLPQETIVFNGGRLYRQTDIELSSGAEFLCLEWLVLGRAAHGEEMVSGYISDGWSVKRDGRLVWADCFRVTDEMFPHLRRNALLSNFKSVATFIYFGPDLDTRLESLRDIVPSLECRCTATSVGGLIVVRLAAEMSADLRAALRKLLQQFSRDLAPGPFRVPKMWSC